LPGYFEALFKRQNLQGLFSGPIARFQWKRARVRSNHVSMKWLSAGLIFVNLSTVCGLLLGMAGNGLNELSAVLALVSGGTFALAAYLGTSDSATQHNISNSPTGESFRSPPRKRYRHVWFWAMAACFALFAVRSGLDYLPRSQRSTHFSVGPVCSASPVSYLTAA